MSVKRLDKLPKRKVTVDELIYRSDIIDVISDLYERRETIKDELLAMWNDEDGFLHYTYTGTKSRLLWLLEKVKLEILGED